MAAQDADLDLDQVQPAGTFLLDVLEREFELSDPGAFLRGLAERLASRLRQLEAQTFELETQHDVIGSDFGSGCLGCKPRLAFLVPGGSLGRIIA